MRQAVWSDAVYLYGICLGTADSGKDAAALFNDPLLVGQYYAAPYLFYDPSCCFVVEDEGVPKGYILGAADTGAFNRWMETLWLPPLRRRYPDPYPEEKIRTEAERNMLRMLHWPLPPDNPFPGYPAHLHIDLLPEIQGKGWGRSLMEALLGELRKRRVPGVHLGVGRSNTAAAAFYYKMGFTLLEEAGWGFNLGKPIQGLDANPDCPGT